jgi:glycosyltransferase involved in cell wall biosynthesis
VSHKKKNIKVTYLVDFYRTEQAGTEKQLSYLLKNLPKKGFWVKLISLQDSEFLRNTASNRFPQVSILSLGANSDISKSLPAIGKLFIALIKERPNIVHTFFPTANTLGVLIAMLSGIRCVITSRRDMAFNLTSRDVSLLRIANRFVSCVICNACAVRDKAIALEGIAKDKTSVIYNGIEFDNGSRLNVSQTSGAPVIGIVANLNRPVKRVDLFLQAAKQVRRHYTETIFWIIGDGPLRPELEKLTHTLKIDNCVVFHGRRNDVSDLMESMSIGVICSDSEGFSNSVMEYMAAGLPVIATDSGGNAEIVDHGRNGILTPPGDVEALAGAMQYLLSYPERAKAMGRSGYNKIKSSFTMKNMITSTITIYKSKL